MPYRGVKFWLNSDGLRITIILPEVRLDWGTNRTLGGTKVVPAPFEPFIHAVGNGSPSTSSVQATPAASTSLRLANLKGLHNFALASQFSSFLWAEWQGEPEGEDCHGEAVKRSRAQ